MLVRVLVALWLALASTSAWGEIGTIDNVPAATLLFPHFEVDTASAQGVNTILTVQNSSATAVVANVTLWTDLGLPTASFHIYMTGYDQETVDLGAVFRRRLPVTASAGQDGGGTISPRGSLSQDINFASCSGTLPNAQNGNILSRGLIDAHRGLANGDYFGGLCGARRYNDTVARGYVTVDTVNACSLLNPSDGSLYFANMLTTDQNLLMGDYVMVDPANDHVFAETAVHIEASAVHPLTTPGPNKQTFYGRFVGFNADDHREPLPTAWAGRASAGRTGADYWRDPGITVAPFTCGSQPPGYPSGQNHVALFDSAGTATGTPTANLFPFAAGTAAGASLGVTAPLGWIFANLNLDAPSGPSGSIRQSWVTFRQIPSAQPAGTGAMYSVPGISLGNAATGADPVIP